MTGTYRLRLAGVPFLLAVAAVVAVPYSPTAAAGLCALAVITTVAERRVTPRAVRAGLVAGSAVGVYASVVQGGTVGAVSALLIGMVAATACGDDPDRVRVEVRALAVCELFVYASVVGLQLGLVASNENRLFRTSTVGGVRFSFAFASSPSQAAMIGGAAVILAVMATVTIRPGRRVLLAGAGAWLVWGANYRFVVLVVVGVLAVYWWPAWRARETDRRMPRSLTVVALVVAALPVWWGASSSLLAEPLANVVGVVPGLGTRSAALQDIDEVRTLNRRTVIWESTFDLIADRASTRQLLVGFGKTGGDFDFRAEISRVAGGNFTRTDTFSAHNTWLEQVRRLGLVGGGLLVLGAVALFAMSRRLLTGGGFAAAAMLVAAGGADIAAVPMATIVTALFVTLCFPAFGQVRSEPSSSRRRRTATPCSPPRSSPHRQLSPF